MVGPLTFGTDGGVELVAVLKKDRMSFFLKAEAALLVLLLDPALSVLRLALALGMRGVLLDEGVNREDDADGLSKLSCSCSGGTSRVLVVGTEKRLADSFRTEATLKREPPPPRVIGEAADLVPSTFTVPGGGFTLE